MTGRTTTSRTCRGSRRRRSRAEIAVFSLLATLAIPLTMSGCARSEPRTIVLQPGSDINAVASNAPDGSVIILEPGIYRLQSIKLRDDQKLVGKDGAVLVGAMVPKNWQKRGKFWVATDLPPPLPRSGECEKRRAEICAAREDLFVDGVYYERVRSLAEMGPQKWFWSERDNAAHISVDPASRTVELGIAPYALGGAGRNITVENIVVEKYASQAQHGAVDARDGFGWTLRNITVRWNHGVGLYLGPKTHVIGGVVVNNGQLGIGGGSVDSIVDGVEIAYNNYARYNWGWEGGGTKFAFARNLIVRNACVHDNWGPGLWTDIDNVNTLYEGNRVFGNAGSGIKHEISFDARIRNNIVAHNGASWDNWLWGSQILIQNSSDVEVYDNVVEVAPSGGNGVGMIYQDRGPGLKLGRWLTQNNKVHDNLIVILGDTRRTGIVTDYDIENFWKTADNSLDRNHYVVPDRSARYWMLLNRELRWPELRRTDFEKNGRLTVQRRSPMTISCQPSGERS